MLTIQATEDELKALRQLLHRAVLHSGMEAAVAACHWDRKITDAMKSTRPGANGGTHPELDREVHPRT